MRKSKYAIKCPPGQTTLHLSIIKDAFLSSTEARTQILDYLSLTNNPNMHAHRKSLSSRTLQQHCPKNAKKKKKNANLLNILGLFNEQTTKIMI